MKIESWFSRGEPKVRFRGGKNNRTPLVIFFIDMKQYDPVTGVAREVRRVGPDNMMTRLARSGRGYFRSLETGKKHEAVKQFIERRDQLWKIRDELRPEIDLDEERNLANNLAAKIVSSGPFFVISMFLVVANAIWIAVEADTNDAELLSDAPIGIQIVEHFFCAAFTVELGIRFAAYRFWRDAYHDTWFRFDFVLVTLMIIETWILPSVVAGSGSGGILGNLTILRMVRLARLTRMTRVLRAVPEVLTLVKGLMAAIRAVFLTIVLMGAIVFLYAIIFKTESLEDVELHDEYFSSISHAAGTLMVHGILLDDIASVFVLLFSSARPRLKVMLFLSFVFVTTFTVLNMLIGILCEVVAEVDRREQDRAQIAYLRHNLLEFLELYDADKDKSITQTELTNMMTNPEVDYVLRKFGTDVGGMVILLDVLFEDKQLHMYQKRILEVEAEVEAQEAIDNMPIISTTKSALNMMAPEPSLSFAEVLDVVLRLRGGNTACVTDITELRMFTAKLFQGVTSHMKRLDAIRTKVLRLQPTPEEYQTHREALQDACARTQEIVRQFEKTPTVCPAEAKPALVKVSLRFESGHTVWRLHRSSTAVGHMLDQLETLAGPMEARRRGKGFFFQGPVLDREAPLAVVVNGEGQLHLDVVHADDGLDGCVDEGSVESA